jgi:hypothetical protein
MGWVKLPAHRAGLPGNVDLITQSAVPPRGHPADLPADRKRKHEKDPDDIARNDPHFLFSDFWR